MPTCTVTSRSRSRAAAVLTMMYQLRCAMPTCTVTVTCSRSPHNDVLALRCAMPTCTVTSWSRSRALLRQRGPLTAENEPTTHRTHTTHRTLSPECFFRVPIRRLFSPANKTLRKNVIDAVFQLAGVVKIPSLPRSRSREFVLRRELIEFE